MWLVQLLKVAFPARFLMARMTRVPALGRVVDRLCFDGDDLIYLPARRVIPVNRALASPEEMVVPAQVVERFVERAGFIWRMNACICRDARQCRDYPIDLGCLFLGEAAKGINPKLGRPVSREEALAHLRRCREAGLVHMVGRNKLDTLWLGVGPGSRLLTICNCCPCCCLWRILPDLAPGIGAKVAGMPGVRVTVTGRCRGCGTCTRDICFVGAIRLDGKRAVVGEACRGCGRCVSACPHQAIELVLEDADAVEHSIARLAVRVDVS